MKYLVLLAPLTLPVSAQAYISPDDCGAERSDICEAVATTRSAPLHDSPTEMVRLLPYLLPTQEPGDG